MLKDENKMAIPLSYNVRNLLEIALTVATAVSIMALLAGLNRAFGSTGDPLNVLMLRKGFRLGAGSWRSIAGATGVNPIFLRPLRLAR
jgi:hypothetical protein